MLAPRGLKEENSCNTSPNSPVKDWLSPIAVKVACIGRPARFSITASSNHCPTNCVDFINACLPIKVGLICSILILRVSAKLSLLVNLPNTEFPTAASTGSIVQKSGPIAMLFANDSKAVCFANPPEVQSSIFAVAPSCHPISLDFQSSPTNILIIGSTKPCPIILSPRPNLATLKLEPNMPAPLFHPHAVFLKVTICASLDFPSHLAVPAQVTLRNFFQPMPKSLPSFFHPCFNPRDFLPAINFLDLNIEPNTLVKLFIITTAIPILNILSHVSL